MMMIKLFFNEKGDINNLWNYQPVLGVWPSLRLTHDVN